MAAAPVQPPTQDDVEAASSIWGWLHYWAFLIVSALSAGVSAFSAAVVAARGSGSRDAVIEALKKDHDELLQRVDDLEREHNEIARRVEGLPTRADFANLESRMDGWFREISRQIADFSRRSP